MDTGDMNSKIEIIMGDGSPTPETVKNAVESRIAEMPRTPGTMNAAEINHSFGICVDSERLSDGSRVWNVLTSDTEINCLSERHARELALAIAVAIRNAL